MMDNTKAEIEVGPQIMIKPSSPTPHHKRFVKLSLIDQINVPIYVSLIAFYSASETVNPDNITDQHVALKTSLSKILTNFYPYAGRILENSSIECADQGVVYAEAEVNCNLSDVISKKGDGNHPTITFKQLLPDLTHLNEVGKIPLIIQSNSFKCGGFALAIMGSHKVMDGLGLSTFIRNWALITSADHNKINHVEGDHPDFTIPSSLHPPSNLLNITPENLQKQSEAIAEKCITKNFVFEGRTSIAALKVKLGTTPQPSRIEAVSALIWKCAMKSSRFSLTKMSSSMWGLLVNTRGRWEVPLPDNTPGNHACIVFVQNDYIDEDTKIDDQELMCSLVYLFKDGLKEFCDNRMKKLQDNSLKIRSSAIIEYMKENEALGKRDDADMYLASSWCGFKLYNADFGWDRPEWVRPNILNAKKFILLMDTKEGNGIEAWVCLEEKHMVAFEQDKDLLMFAYHRPAYPPTFLNP